MPTRLLAAVFLTLFVAACDDDPPTSPSGSAGSLTFGAIAPGSGGSVTTTGSTPGAMIVRGSGQVSIPITVSAGRELPWAQLSVYLMKADGTDCGQNLPEHADVRAVPLQRHRDGDDSAAFKVYQLPCSVTGVRAYLDTRNNGLLIPLDGERNGG